MNAWHTINCPRCKRPCHLIETPVGWHLILIECESTCTARQKFAKPGWILIDRPTILEWGGSWRNQMGLDLNA